MVLTVTQTKKYNPIPGKFPYKGPFININGGANGLTNLNECPTYFNGCAPAAESCVSGASGPIAFAIHGDIYKYDDKEMTETAWAAECLQYGPDGIFGCQEWGTDFAGKNWATYVHVPCYTGQQGICASGVLSCDGGATFCQSIQSPQAEICDDGIDNDCDGATDCGDSDCAEDPACSCEGSCGGSAPGGCYCDEDCIGYGDCCADVCDACGELTFCTQPTGACCYPEGSCDDEITGSECESGGGSYEGDGTTCAAAQCLAPVGACCFDDSSCIEIEGADCNAQDGAYQGDDIGCGEVECLTPD